MTVSNDTNRAGPYVGNDSNKTFPFTEIKVFDADDLTVVFIDSDGVDSILTRGADYTVSLNSDQNTAPGGSITYPIDINADPLSTDEYITIFREVDEKQESDITNLGGFYPEIIENMADRAMMVGQQNEERGLRSIRFSRGATNGQIASMEIPAGTRSKQLAIGSTGLLELATLTDTALTASMIYAYLSPIDIRLYGAIADNGVTDNQPLIQNAIADAYAAGGGAVYVPSGKGKYYGIDYPLIMLPGVYLIGDGYWSWIKNTQTGAVWDAYVIMAGTYGGWGNADDMHAEDSYDIVDVTKGDLITFNTPGDGSNFTVGQPVIIEDARVYTVGANDYPTRTLMARVKDADANTITLDRQLPGAFAETGGIKPRAYVLNSDTVDWVGSATYSAFVLDRGGIANMRIESSNDRLVQTIHFATFECEFRNLWIKGPTGIIGNPINWTLFENVNCLFGRMGQEMGYCSGDNTLRNVRWNRFADTDDANASYGLRENWDGGGRNEYYGCHLDDHTLYSNGGILALFNKEGSKWFGGSLKHQSAAGDLHATVSITSGVSGEDLANNFVLRDAEIIAGNTSGIFCSASRCVIEGNVISGVDASYYPIQLSVNAKNCWVKGNRLGGYDETGTHLKIRDDSFGINGHFIENIEINPILHSHHTTGTQLFTGDTNENSVASASFTIPANVLRIGDTYQTLVKGAITAGSANDTKTIRVYLNSTVVYSYVFLAAQGTTLLPFEVVVESLVYAADNQTVHGTLKATDGTFDFDALIGPTAPTDATITIDVTVQLANASDSVTVRQVAHRVMLEKRWLDTGLQQ